MYDMRTKKSGPIHRGGKAIRVQHTPSPALPPIQEYKDYLNNKRMERMKIDPNYRECKSLSAERLRMIAAMKRNHERYTFIAGVIPVTPLTISKWYKALPEHLK